MINQCADIRMGFAWCIYIGSLSLSHLGCGCRTYWWLVAGNPSALDRRKGQISSSLRDPPLHLCFALLCFRRLCTALMPPSEGMRLCLWCSVCTAKGKLVGVCRRWKRLIYQLIFNPRTARARFPWGQWQMKAQMGSGREDITAFSFEAVWCSALWWFGHYFMSIIKKTSNKMLNSKSDHTEIEMCVFCAPPSFFKLS